MTAALRHEDPVVFMEHKLLSESWLEFLGSSGRRAVSFDVPAEGARGPCPRPWQPLPFGKAICRREGTDVTLASVGVGVHRALEAAVLLEKDGISAEVLDLRSVSPLDVDAIRASVSRTGGLVAVDEDYQGFGLTGELAAVVAEAGIPARFARVATSATIPYARNLEAQALPSAERIRRAGMGLAQGGTT
jgi:acetoin:2,6-dichlorophenolindophenol oxidoreductase subunit beta